MSQEIEDFLAHYGVKGMKWGVRKDRDGIPRRTNREAKKDAEEFAQAKMFYGKGAGTRRKLIKNTVEAKKKRDSAYGKAFEKHLAEQDMAKRAAKARTERKRTDRKEKTKQRAGYVARSFTGEMGTQAAFTAVALGGAAYLRTPKGQAAVKRSVSRVMDAKDAAMRHKGAKHINDFLKKNM